MKAFYQFFFLLWSLLDTPVSAQEFFLGEAYAYKLTYLSIPAVNIYLTVPETVTVNGKKTYHLLAVARTNALFSPFYTLENRYHTYIDAVSGLPVKFSKEIHQRTLDQRGEILFDQTERQAVYDGGRFSSQIKMTIQENTHNLFSMIYSLRRGDMHVGQKFRFNLDVESEPWKAEAEVIKKETVKAADALHEAYKISIQFSSVREEFKRKHTDILTRRVATSKTRLYFWIGAAAPYPFLKVEYEMAPFSTFTTLVKE